MAWIKLDDGFTRHPRILAVTLEARWAYLEALCYAARYATDGIVPDPIAANGSIRAELLEAGLWQDRAEAGIAIHDFLDYNPSREDRDRKHEAKRVAGAIGAAKRYGIARPVPSQKKDQERAERARDPLFDALAEAEGSNPGELTRRAARTIGVAIAEIRKATPDVTTEEIRRRAEMWPRVFPDATFTASALAKHWARLSRPTAKPRQHTFSAYAPCELCGEIHGRQE